MNGEHALAAAWTPEQLQRARANRVEVIWDRACKDALRLQRLGRFGRAEFLLVRAGMKVAWILGDAASYDDLAGLRLVEPFAVAGEVAAP